MSAHLAFTPYLIQRLNPPDQNASNGPSPSEIFSFGGGFKNGGLTKEAMGLLRPHFSFDYMGAAEFEFGALPKSLRSLWVAANEKKQAVARVLTVKVTPAKKMDPKKKRYQPPADSKKQPVEMKVYVIAADESHLDIIREFLESQTITDDYGWPKSGSGYCTKEATYVWNALALPERGDYRDTIGGIDIENSWMWFKKRETLEAMCQIFGIEVPAED